METNLIVIFTALLLVIGICLFSMTRVIKFFNRKQLFDVPDSRKQHAIPIPTSGGVIFVIPIIGAVLLTSFTSFEVYIVLAFLTLSIAGFIDDRFDMSSRVKFLIQFATASFYVGFFGGMDFFENAFALNPINSKVITVIFIVGIINAFNLMDGSDGLSGLFALLVFSIFAVFSFFIGDSSTFVYSILILGSIAVFLKFNWNPAKVFMGDTGSLALGLLIVIFGIRLSNYSGESLLPFEIIFFPLLALPVIDTLRVMSWRMKLKKNPFKADRTHFHHLLQFLKLKPRSIALTYILLTSVVVFTAIVVYEIQSNVLSSLLIAMFTACVVFAVVLYLDKQKQIRMMRKNKDKMYAMMSKNQLLIKSLIR